MFCKMISLSFLRMLNQVNGLTAQNANLPALPGADGMKPPPH
jgi:hypothetical protein